MRSVNYKVVVLRSLALYHALNFVGYHRGNSVLSQRGSLEEKLCSRILLKPGYQYANAGLYLVYNEVDQSGLGATRRDAQQFIIKYSRTLNIFY